jgi:DNA-binding CsgD family transcriptional regulator
MSTTTSRRRTGSLTAREREILGLLATGLRGAEIAEQLVLSPETVRTHVRNAMAKLGASTRSQAVVLAMKSEEITTAGGGEDPGADSSLSPVGGTTGPPSLDELLGGLCELYDVDAAIAYVADEDGLSLRRSALAAGEGSAVAELPEAIALGDGPLGRAALERRAQLVPVGDTRRANGAGRHPVIVAPMVAGGRLVGVLGLAVRASRPTGRGELLLAQAFAARVGEIVAAGGAQAETRLARALERFRASWSATTGS